MCMGGVGPCLGETSSSRSTVYESIRVSGKPPADWVLETVESCSACFRPGGGGRTFPVLSGGFPAEFATCRSHSGCHQKGVGRRFVHRLHQLVLVKLGWERDGKSVYDRSAPRLLRLRREHFRFGEPNGPLERYKADEERTQKTLLVREKGKCLTNQQRDAPRGRGTGPAKGVGKTGRKA